MHRLVKKCYQNTVFCLAQAGSETEKHASDKFLELGPCKRQEIKVHLLAANRRIPIHSYIHFSYTRPVQPFALKAARLGWLMVHYKNRSVNYQSC